MTTPTMKVNTRKYSYRDLVLKEWGEEWSKPDTAYQFSNGRKFDSSDRGTSGIYKKG